MESVIYSRYSKGQFRQVVDISDRYDSPKKGAVLHATDSKTVNGQLHKQ